MQIHSVGFDLGKATFHLVALGAAGKVIVRKKFTRMQLLAYTANLPASLIGLEACSGAHFLGRALRKQGHDVRLIPAQFVKPFVKSNKNDFIDAEAIAEAVERKNMRFVPIKSDDQLDLQGIHRVRDRVICRRTAVINQLRGFLLERGMVFAQRPANLKAAMADILENAEADLTLQMRIRAVQALYLLALLPGTKTLELHEVQPPAAARAEKFAAKNAPAGQRQIRTISVRSVRAGHWDDYLPAPASASGSGKRRLREVHGQRGLLR